MFMTEEQINKIELILGESISDSSQIPLSTCHKSYLNEISRSNKSIQKVHRLYVLGGYLYRIIREHIAFIHISQDPKFLSNLHQETLRSDLMESIVEFLGIDQMYKCGKGLQISEVQSDWKLFPFIAAVYLQCGYSKLVDILSDVILTTLRKVVNKPFTDWKTILHEWTQSRKGNVEYKLIGEEGPSHDKKFFVEVIALGKTAIGSGKSKKVAEKDAAYNYIAMNVPQKEVINPLSKKIVEYKLPEIYLNHRRVDQLRTLTDMFPAEIVLLHQSFTHNSYLNENRHLLKYEYASLAYLGSWVQFFIYYDYLCRCYTGLEDDELIHSALPYLTSDDFNSKIFEQINLGSLLWVGKGQWKTGITNSIKSNVIQALYGSVFLSAHFNGNSNLLNLYNVFNRLFIKGEIHEFKKEEYYAKSELQNLIQNLPGNWIVKFDREIIKQSHESEILGIARVVNEEIKVTYEWSSIGRSVAEATNTAAQSALRDVKGTFSLDSQLSVLNRTSYKDLVVTFINEITVPLRYTARTLRPLLVLVGWNWLELMIEGEYDDAVHQLELFFKVMDTFQINAEHHIRGILEIVGVNFKVDYYDGNDIQNHFNSLTSWLQNISPTTPIEELDGFLSGVIDSMQVFRIITNEEFYLLPLKETISDVLLLKPKKLQVSIIADDEQGEVFGQRSFLNWLFYILLSDIQNSRFTNQEVVNLNILINNYRNCMRLEIKYDASSIKPDLLNKLSELTGLLTLSFAKLYLDKGIILIEFYNPFDADYVTDLRVRDFCRLVHEKMIDSIIQLSPLGGIVHDLKNSMTTLKTMMRTESTLYTVDFIRVRDSCLDRAESLRSYFLHSRPNYDQINLFDLIGQLSKKIRVIQREDFEIDFSVYLITDLIYSDSAMIDSIVMNLSKNAIESMDHMGKIGLRFEMWDKSALLITLLDNGRGIPKIKMENLFSSFFTTKSNVDGTGLGLPTVKRYVDLLDGLIEVDSTEKVGTTIKILLPL